MIKLNWRQTNRQERPQNQDAFLTGNIIKLEKPAEYLRWPEKRPTQEAIRMCEAIRSGKIKQYLELLRNMPEKKVISKFLGIIYSKSSGLPILCDEEKPVVIIAGTSLNPIQNTLARMMAKTTILLIIESESKKLGIWNRIQPPWTEKYIRETRTYVQLLEAIIRQCENSVHADKIPELHHTIELIKDSNRQYAINW